MANRDYHIAIVGGGIGGLALAVGLLQHDVPFTLFEAAAGFGTVGAGVGLGPNAIRAMHAIKPGFRELYDQISSGNVTPGKDHVMMDAMYIEEGFGDARGWKPVSYGAACYNRTSAHRKDLLDILTSWIPAEKVQFQKRVKGLGQHGRKVAIDFEDGEREIVDAVIGCDGVKGLSRNAVIGGRWPQLVPARYTGRYVYRSIVPMANANDILGMDVYGNDIAGDAKMFMGDKAIITTFPISKGTQCNLVCFKLVGDQPWTHPEWTQQVSKDEMRQDLLEAGIDTRLVKMLNWAEPPLRWSIHDHPVTPTYFNERICLLGDSAHATTPHQAAGAGQCLEDALVLSKVLSRCQKSSELVAAFAAYDGVRRPRAQRVVQTSREAGDIFSFQGKDIGGDMVKIVDNMNERFLWIWDHDILGDADLATQNFNQIVLKVAQRKAGAVDTAKESVLSTSTTPPGVGAGIWRRIFKWIRSVFRLPWN